MGLRTNIRKYLYRLKFNRKVEINNLNNRKNGNIFRYVGNV